MLVSLSMNYQNDGHTHQELIDNLTRHGLIKSSSVGEVMNKVDRKEFVGSTCSNPYVDKPQDIGCGATITSPYMHAIALEALHDSLQPGMKALDIGSGSGYLTVCMALLLGPQGKAIGLDHSQDLIRQSEVNVSKSHKDLLSQGTLIFKVGEGMEGLRSEGPYDCIHLGAAVEKVPKELIEQLKVGGRMLVPVVSADRSGEQDLMLIEKTGPQDFTSREIMKCVYSLMESSIPEIVPETDPLVEVNEAIAGFEKELVILGDQIKNWNQDFKKNNNDRKPSLRDYRQDPAMAQWLTQSKTINKMLEKHRYKKQDILAKRTQR